MTGKGWFDEQIKNRLRYDEESFRGAFDRLSSVVLGQPGPGSALDSDRRRTRNAIEEILGFYNVKGGELPDSIEDINDQLEYLLRPAGIMRRVVSLQGEWWKDASGPMLGQTAAGGTVALLPSGFSGYSFFDYARGQRLRLSRQTAPMIQEQAFCFYRPFPMKELGLKDLVHYLAGTLTRADVAAVVAIGLVLTLLGLFTPYATRMLFDGIIPSGQAGLLLPIGVLLVGIMLSSTLFTITRSLLLTRLQTRINISAEAAAMSRLLSLPASFFKEENAGTIAARLTAMGSLCQLLAGTLFSTVLTALFSLVYLLQVFSFTPSLLLPAMLILTVQLTLTMAASLVQLRLTRRQMQTSASLQGLTFAIFTGIQKIKLAGAERRVFARWADSYGENAALLYDPPWIIKIQPVLAGLVSLGGTIALYFSAASSAVSVADYMAFTAAYGLVSGAVMSLAMVATTLANIKPMMEMLAPVLKNLPESGENKEIVSRLSGSIEINNLSFRYGEGLPLVLDNLSLKIKAGQYVAIVGQTGCGKSTLMRLLLGFESPQTGAIYYDGRDLARLDLRSVRQNIGSVLQNGRLFAGDIYSNIVVSAPWLTVDDAWAAAELAGIADDIRAMPMGMHTMISEGSGGISGGQRQRLMIARAIAPGPRILIFDEATSALDNITQKQVSDALEALKNTRIVIAHRLSTIMHCDRIIVLDQGKIREDGTYHELIERAGYFAGLVARQRLDD